MGGSVLKLKKSLALYFENSFACFANFIHFLLFDLSSDNINALDFFWGGGVGRTTPIITLKMHNVADQFEKYKLTQKCKFILSIQIK